MATAAVDEDEDVLTCIECLKRYTDPRTLDCKHSFCRRCLTNHVKTHVDAVKTKTIPCPSCPQVTRVPDPSRPVDEWAGQLQPGHVVQELMARVNMNIPIEGTPCDLCQQLGETTPGKFWCSECEMVFCQRCGRGHTLIPSCSDHDLLDLRNQGQISRGGGYCREHRDQRIELYCKDCNASHCSLCHRECEDVVTLKYFVSTMMNELSELNNQLLEREKKSNTRIEDQKTRISKLNADKLSVIDEIRCASQEAVDLVKKKAKQLIDQVDEMTNRENNELKAKVKLENVQVQTYRQYSEYIKQAVSSDSEVEVCDVYQAWKCGQLEVSQEGDKGMGAGNISYLRFSKERQNIAEILDTLHLGNIEATYPPTDFLSFSQLSESFDTRVDEDKNNPYMHDITVMEVGGVHTIVVTDTDNTCVKSLYTKNNKSCHSRLELNGRLGGIALIGDNKVMIAVSIPNQIVTVSVTPDLVLMTNINTSKGYSSLAVMSPTRLAAGGLEIGVDILNMQGEVIKSVNTYNNKKLFSNPKWMCVNNTGHLLVSDWHLGTVTCLTPEGQVVWIYSSTGRGSLSNPSGIITTPEGDILVADRALGKVIQLTPTGKYVRDVVLYNGLWSPQGFCVDKNGSLFICDCGRVLKYVFRRK